MKLGINVRWLGVLQAERRQAGRAVERSGSCCCELTDGKIAKETAKEDDYRSHDGLPGVLCGTYQGRPSAGEVRGRGGSEGDGCGVSERFGGQDAHHNCHVGSHAPLTPRPVTDGKLQIVPGGSGQRKGGLGEFYRMGKRRQTIKQRPKTMIDGNTLYKTCNKRDRCTNMV